MELTFKKNRRSPSKLVVKTPESEIWKRDVKSWNEDLLELKKYIHLASMALEHHTIMYNRHRKRLWSQKSHKNTGGTVIPNYGYADGFAFEVKDDLSNKRKQHSNIGRMHAELKKYHGNIKPLIKGLKNALRYALKR